MSQKLEDVVVEQKFPPDGNVPLEGLYLSQNLRKVSEKMGRAVVIANYVTDIQDVIAKKDENGVFQVAGEIKNPYDWRLFQELTAQADVIITGGDYLARFKKQGEGAQNVLTQFEKGGKFEELGDWRVENGYAKRSPDIAIPSRSLDFEIPQSVLESGRRVILFTTSETSRSENSQNLKKQGAEIVIAGEQGVDGKIMIDYLSEKCGYKVIKMTTGPRVLALLLDAKVLDRLYITQVQLEIKYSDPSEVLTVLGDRGKVENLADFKLTQKYLQENVKLDDGTKASQRFLVYDSAFFIKNLSQ